MNLEMEKRLVEFAGIIHELTGKLTKSYISDHLSNQIIRSSTACALNFGEMQSAESRRDFIHKMSIVLKELRETYVNLSIIHRTNLTKDQSLDKAIKENAELIAIFQKSVSTAVKNNMENN